MIQIRQNIFETNSSSTHSLTICREDEFDKWKNGEIYLIIDYPWSAEETKEVEAMKNKTFISKEDAIIILEQCADKYDFKDLFSTYNNFFYDYDYYDDSLNRYQKEYTDNQTNVTYIAFGKYGYDG